MSSRAQTDVFDVKITHDYCFHAQSCLLYSTTIWSKWCFRSAPSTVSTMWHIWNMSVFLYSIPHCFIYLCELALIFCRQLGADLFSLCTTGLLHLNFPMFLHQRVPPQPHPPLQLQIVVLPGCLKRESLPQSHKPNKIL